MENRAARRETERNSILRQRLAVAPERQQAVGEIVVQRGVLGVPPEGRPEPGYFGVVVRAR